MQVGFALPTSGSWATPDNQVALGRRAEELGYTTLWTFQRLLYPADPTEGRWPSVYRNVTDPLITLAFMAAHTSRVRLGVAVVNMPYFSPALLAKQATTLDVVSGGRLDLGLGIGWVKEEYAAVGAPYERRGARADDFLACLRALWTPDEDGVVSYQGEFHQVPASFVAPRPVQVPHPPILLGGTAEPALRRAGRLADGWMSSSGQALDSVRSAIDVVRDAAVESGRDPGRLRFISRGVVRVRPGGAQDRRPLTGSLDEIRADLATIAGQGVTELFVDLNFDDEVSAPDADPAASTSRGHEVLEALAPGA